MNSIFCTIFLLLLFFLSFLLFLFFFRTFSDTLRLWNKEKKNHKYLSDSFLFLSFVEIVGTCETRRENWQKINKKIKQNKKITTENTIQHSKNQLHFLESIRLEQRQLGKNMIQWFTILLIFISQQIYYKLKLLKFITFTYALWNFFPGTPSPPQTNEEDRNIC